LIVRAEQLNHSAIAALGRRDYQCQCVLEFCIVRQNMTSTVVKQTFLALDLE